MSFADQLYRAIKRNDLEKGIELLNNPKFKPSKHQNWAIIKAVEKKRFEFVDLLLKDGRISPANYSNLAVRSSISKDDKIFNLLIQDPRVDLSDHENSGFHSACFNGHLNIVKVFLKDYKVDPSSRNQWGINRAIKNKKINVIKLLLKDPRINPVEIQDSISGYESTLYLSLELNDNNEIFKLLLNYKHKKNSYSSSFLKTILENNNEAFDLLLNVRMVNSTQYDFISAAAKTGNLYALKKMVECKKFHVKKDSTLLEAAMSDNIEIFDFVLSHSYFEKPNVNSLCLLRVCKNKNLDFLKLLLNKFNIDYQHFNSVVLDAITESDIEKILIIKKSLFGKKYLKKEQLFESEFLKLNRLFTQLNIKEF